MANILKNESLYTFGKCAAGAVYTTTALKAIVRPAFIYADKKSDAETKKYTAGKEFLYQILCLGITIGLLPFFKLGGLKIAQKYIKEEPKLAGLLKELDKTPLFKKVSAFEHRFKRIKVATEKLSKTKKEDITTPRMTTMNTVNGCIEAGSFVGSILGLTIIAPLISHKILHPVMNVLGLEKKHDIGKPAEIFLADAKVPEQGNNVNVKA